MPTLQNKLVDKKAVAKALKLSIRTVTSLVSKGDIPCIRLSPRLVRFDLDEVFQALEKFKRGGQLLKL